jgi:Flp pilus assembly protein TadG
MRRIMRLAREAAGHIGEDAARTLQWARNSSARLLCDARGNVSVMLGLSAIGLVGGVGIAIDTSVAYNVRSQLAAAVDSAALAGARAFASPNRDADIANFFAANFQDGYMGSILQPLEIAADNEARTVTVTARATIPTFFMSVLGTDSTDISATAEATLSSRDVEVSLVLDITGSMSGQEMIDLRAAANELVDIVVQDLQDPFYSKVALVPYSNSVNVGSYAEAVRGITSSGVCTTPTCDQFEFPEADSGDPRIYDVSTCVTPRSGPHLATDAAPSLAPFGKQYSHATYNACPPYQMVPLSSDKTALHTAINALQDAGSTAGHIGLAWGWYLISPNFAYLFPTDSQPRDYGEIHLGQEVLKVVVIMTDGDFNTIYHDGVIAKNSGTGSGADEYKIDANATNGTAFEQADNLCDNIKAEGVVVYTVGLGVASFQGAQDFVNNCATSADHVYLPSTGTEMKQAFRDIAVQVSNLRISM